MQYAHSFCFSDDLENQTRFAWDRSHLLQEINSASRYTYTYIYTNPDSYEPLAQVHNSTNEDGESRQQTHYFHCDQIGIPREITDKDGNLVWFGDYTGLCHLKGETNVTGTAHKPLRLQNQYYDEETRLHYNLLRYYEPEAGRLVNQDSILLLGGSNLYSFTSNTNTWWNLTPVKHLHTGTIHGTGSALRTHFPYSTPTGIINQIVPR